MRSTRWLSIAVYAPFLGACYSYATINPETAHPNMDVRVRVSQTASTRIAPLVGSSNARLLTGTVVDTASGSMIVEVPTVSQVEAGGYVQTLHQRVSLTRGDVVELESRTFDRMRTGVIVGAAAVLIGGSAIKAFRNQSGKDSGPTGGPNDALVPLLAHRIP